MQRKEYFSHDKKWEIKLEHSYSKYFIWVYKNIQNLTRLAKAVGNTESEDERLESAQSNELMNEKVKRQTVYLKAPHIPWISCILQAVLIAF